MTTIFWKTVGHHNRHSSAKLHLVMPWVARPVVAACGRWRQKNQNPETQTPVQEVTANVVQPELLETVLQEYRAMAQLVMYLICNHEDLSLGPSASTEKPGIAAAPVTLVLQTRYNTHHFGFLLLCPRSTNCTSTHTRLECCNRHLTLTFSPLCVTNENQSTCIKP